MNSEAVIGETLPLDSLFHALGDQHRLRILVSLYLADPEEEYWAEDLVAVGEDPDATIPAFYHVHFPKLADMDLVEWDREVNTVRRGPAFRAVDTLLDSLAVRDDDLLVELLSHEV